MKTHFILTITSLTFAGVLSFVADKIAPISMWLLFASLMVVADTLSGVMSAVIKEQPLQSNKLRKMFPKIIQYMLAIGVTFAIENMFVSEMIETGLKLTYGVVSLIVVSESVSIMENISGSTGLDLSKIISLIKSKGDNN